MSSGCALDRSCWFPCSLCEKGQHQQCLGGACACIHSGVEGQAEARATSPQDALLHPAHQVFFRAGLIACREYMARFVEAQDPAIATSIRANWWPSLGKDYGPPRQLDFAEVTVGEYGTPEFRARTADEVSPTQEALPIALGFLERPFADPPVAEGAGEPT